jgi:hypothetical protein
MKIFSLSHNIFSGLTVDEATLSDGADISWNSFTDIDQSQFVEYLIKLKKR